MSEPITVVECGLCIIWKINKFSKQEKMIESQKFPFLRADLRTYDLTVVCWPQGDGTTEEGFATFLLRCASSVTFSYTISIVDKKGQIHALRNSTKDSFDGNAFGKQFIKRSELLNNADDFLPEGNLTLRCVVSQGDASGYEEEMLKLKEENSRLSLLSKSFKSLHLNEDHHDVSIVVADQVYPAHKAILSARSAVFKAMFSHEVVENQENKVVISDINESAVKEMLEYIYTGVSPNMQQMPEDLFVAADKYGLEKLKEACASSMSQTLTPDNACRRYLLSSLYGLKNLARDIEAFTSKNIQHVIKSPGFIDLCGDDPKVVVNLLLSRFTE